MTISPLAFGATVPKPHRFPVSPSNTTPNGLNFNVQCTISPPWLTTDFFRDCEAAYQKFLASDVERNETRRFEFHQRGTRSTSQHVGRLVPRRYTVDRCTVAFTLVETFPAGLLPAPAPVPPIGGWPKLDVSSYAGLEPDLLAVILSCTDKAQAGWRQTGDNGGLGFFVFGTDSDVHRAIPGLNPTVALKNETHGTILPTSLPVSTPPSNATFNRPTTPCNFHPQCTSSHDWRMPSFSRDCSQALEHFRTTEVTRYGSAHFDFHKAGVPYPVTHPSQMTPRRYTYNKCTIGIAMIQDVAPDLLPTPVPEPPPGWWPTNDVANYIELYAGLELVLRSCSESSAPAGWVRAGLYGGIGLFMFATDSIADMRVLRPVPAGGQINNSLPEKHFVNKDREGSSAAA